MSLLSGLNKPDSNVLCYIKSFKNEPLTSKAGEDLIKSDDTLHDF